MAFQPTYSLPTERATLAAQGYGVLVDMTMDAVNAYPSGGWVATGIPIQVVLGVITVGGNTAGAGYTLFWNKQTSKFQVLVSNASGSPLIDFAGTFAASTVIRGWVLGY